MCFIRKFLELARKEERTYETSTRIIFPTYRIRIDCMTILIKGGMLQGVMYLLLLSMSAHITKELGMAPGGEFRRLAMKRFYKVLLIYTDFPEIYSQKLLRF